MAGVFQSSGKCSGFGGVSMRMEEYLNTVTEQIRCKKARPLVSEELKAHILDQAEAYEADGMFGDEAMEKAVREMGDPVETGVSLDRVHRPQMSWSMLALVGIISVLSILAQAAFAAYGQEPPAAEYEYLKRHILYTASGYLLMIFVYRLDYSILFRFPRAAAAGFLFLLLIGRGFLGVEYGGMILYMRLGPFCLSIPTFMYLYVPIFGAVLYRYRGDGYKVFARLALWSLIPVLIAFKLPYLGGAVTLLMIFAVLISVAVWQNWYRVNRKRVLAVLWAGILAAPILFFCLLYAAGRMADYQMSRIHAFLSWDRSANYAAALATRCLNSPLFGRSEAFSELMTLPEFKSDFVFISIISAYGILAGIAAAALLSFLLVKIFRISFRQRNQLGMILGCASGTVFLFQMLMCLAMNLGLIPVFSATFPFLSYGGSATVVSYILLGLVLSVYRYKNILAEKPGRKTVGIAP